MKVKLLFFSIFQFVVFDCFFFIKIFIILLVTEKLRDK